MSKRRRKTQASLILTCVCSLFLKCLLTVGAVGGPGVREPGIGMPACTTPYKGYKQVKQGRWAGADRGDHAGSWRRMLAGSQPTSHQTAFVLPALSMPAPAQDTHT